MTQEITNSSFHDAEQQARELSLLMPELILSARQIAQTLVHGSHGRKRAGPGETFWQFRPYENFEPMQNIDWRRSASSDHLYVREREWDAAHTFWLWIDLAPSMWFQSHQVDVSKAVRAIVIGLAIAEMLVRSNERVGVLGLMRPRTGRDILPRIGERLIDGLKAKRFDGSLPMDESISKFSEVILISDFLDDFDKLDTGFRKIGSQQTGGTIMHIIDPAEESLPYHGRVEFKDMKQSQKIIIENADNIRARYAIAFRDHKARLAETLRQLNWGYLEHHTDKPSRQALLHLYGFLSSNYYKTGAMNHAGGHEIDESISSSQTLSEEISL